MTVNKYASCFPMYSIKFTVMDQLAADKQMDTHILDGKKVAELVRAEWKVRADKLVQLGVKPGLAVIIVGNNAASAIYVRNKIKACGDIGIYSEVHSFQRSNHKHDRW